MSADLCSMSMLLSGSDLYAIYLQLYQSSSRSTRSGTLAEKQVSSGSWNQAMLVHICVGFVAVELIRHDVCMCFQFCIWS